MLMPGDRYAHINGITVFAISKLSDFNVHAVCEDERLCGNTVIMSRPVFENAIENGMYHKLLD